MMIRLCGGGKVFIIRSNASITVCHSKDNERSFLLLAKVYQLLSQHQVFNEAMALIACPKQVVNIPNLCICMFSLRGLTVPK